MGFISEELLKGRSGDWEADAFQLTLYTLALGLQAQRVYEIGVGQSTLALLRAVQRTGGKVVSCDANAAMRDFVVQNALDALAHWEFHCKTSEALYDELEALADLIFIDGCHSFSCVKWEFENYWYALKHGGLMVLHDTLDWPEGPGKVMELATQRGLEVVELPFSCGIAVIHKRAIDTIPLKLEET